MIFQFLLDFFGFEQDTPAKRTAGLVHEEIHSCSLLDPLGPFLLSHRDIRVAKPSKKRQIARQERLASDAEPAAFLPAIKSGRFPQGRIVSSR